MGLKQEVEKNRIMFDMLREMVKDLEKMIVNHQKMLEFINKGMKNQDKRIDLIIEELKRLQEEDKDEGNKD